MSPITWTVTLDTPKGQGQIDVPTFGGPEVASRRAVLAAASRGWGDFDDITVTSVEEARDDH